MINFPVRIEGQQQDKRQNSSPERDLQYYQQFQQQQQPVLAAADATYKQFPSQPSLTNTSMQYLLNQSSMQPQRQNIINNNGQQPVDSSFLKKQSQEHLSDQTPTQNYNLNQLNNNFVQPNQRNQPNKRTNSHLNQQQKSVNSREQPVSKRTFTALQEKSHELPLQYFQKSNQQDHHQQQQYQQQQQQYQQPPPPQYQHPNLCELPPDQRLVPVQIIAQHQNQYMLQQQFKQQRSEDSYEHHCFSSGQKYKDSSEMPWHEDFQSYKCGCKQMMLNMMNCDQKKCNSFEPEVDYQDQERRWIKQQFLQSKLCNQQQPVFVPSSKQQSQEFYHQTMQNPQHQIYPIPPPGTCPQYYYPHYEGQNIHPFFQSYKMHRNAHTSKESTQFDRYAQTHPPPHCHHQQQEFYPHTQVRQSNSKSRRLHGRQSYPIESYKDGSRQSHIAAQMIPKNDINWHQIFQGGTGTENHTDNPFFALATSPPPDLRRIMHGEKISQSPLMCGWHDASHTGGLDQNARLDAENSMVSMAPIAFGDFQTPTPLSPIPRQQAEFDLLTARSNNQPVSNMFQNGQPVQKGHQRQTQKSNYVTRPISADNYLKSVLNQQQQVMIEKSEHQQQSYTAQVNEMAPQNYQKQLQMGLQLANKKSVQKQNNQQKITNEEFEQVFGDRTFLHRTKS